MNCVMKSTIIVATGKQGEIGKGNKLLWNLPGDMKFFKETTQNHIVVMGRKNWESIPDKYRPLPNRKNIILTRNKDYETKGADIIHDISELSNFLTKDKICFIIGGSQIYKLALDSNIVSEMYITTVDHTFEADTYFPTINWVNWEVIEETNYLKDNINPYSFTIRKYIRK